MCLDIGGLQPVVERDAEGNYIGYKVFILQEERGSAALASPYEGHYFDGTLPWVSDRRTYISNGYVNALRDIEKDQGYVEAGFHMYTSLKEAELHGDWNNVILMVKVKPENFVASGYFGRSGSFVSSQIDGVDFDDPMRFFADGTDLSEPKELYGWWLRDNIKNSVEPRESCDVS